MITTLHTGRVSKTAFCLILVGLFIAGKGYAEDAIDPNLVPLSTEPVAPQIAEPISTVDAAMPVQPADIIVIPTSNTAPFDPYANSEQPLEIDPALIPPSVK